MLRFLVRRVLGAIVILLIISIFTFLLFYAVPADPARQFCSKVCTPQTLAQVKHNMGIDKPLVVQFWNWFSAIFVGHHYDVGFCHAPCLGYSYAKQEFITPTLINRFPTTFSLSIGAAVIFVIFGVGMGMLAAWKQGRAIDKFASGASLVGAAMQIYIVGVLALWLLTAKFHVLDPPAYNSFLHDPANWAYGLLLPWLVLAIIFTANYTRMTRSQMVEALSEDYVRTARAKGMSGRTVFLRYAWRGAMGPIVTIFGLDIGTLFGGAIITETVFSLHGLGELSIKAVQDNDLPMLLGVVLFAAGAIVICNIIVDAAYAFIDPRVRLA